MVGMDRQRDCVYILKWAYGMIDTYIIEVRVLAWSLYTVLWSRWYVDLACIYEIVPMEDNCLKQ